jgi:hypothetical protein
LRKVLTDALIRAYPKPTNGRVELADVRCVGLSFRITSQGARSWSFRFRDRVSGKIGRLPSTLVGRNAAMPSMIAI